MGKKNARIQEQLKECKKSTYRIPLPIVKTISMKYRILVFLGMLFTQAIAYSQRVIQMEYDNGVYRIPCTVNGANMKMIFDTGAATVCLSLATALFLYQNGYITHTDIKGTGQSSTASGDIVNNVKINLRDIEIGGMHLHNVEGVVMESLNAPLLLGQTAIKKLGTITIRDNQLIINNSYSNGNYNYSGNRNEYSYKTQYFEYNGYKLETKKLIQRLQMQFNAYCNRYNASSKQRDGIATALLELIEFIKKGECSYDTHRLSGVPISYQKSKSKKEIEYVRNAIAYIDDTAAEMVRYGNYVE